MPIIRDEFGRELRNPSPSQIGSVIMGIEQRSNSFAILNLDDDGFIQAAGNRDAYVVECCPAGSKSLYRLAKKISREQVIDMFIHFSAGGHCAPGYRWIKFGSAEPSFAYYRCCFYVSFVFWLALIIYYRMHPHIIELLGIREPSTYLVLLALWLMMPEAIHVLRNTAYRELNLRDALMYPLLIIMTIAGTGFFAIRVTSAVWHRSFGG